MRFVKISFMLFMLSFPSCISKTGSERLDIVVTSDVDNNIIFVLNNSEGEESPVIVEHVDVVDVKKKKYADINNKDDYYMWLVGLSFEKRSERLPVSKIKYGTVLNYHDEVIKSKPLVSGRKYRATVIYLANESSVEFTLK